MSPFDKTWQFKLFNAYWNFGYLSKGKVEMSGWFRLGKYYVASPVFIKKQLP